MIRSKGFSALKKVSYEPQTLTNDTFRADGEVVSDALDFEVEGVLSNKVEITMDKQQSYPGIP